MTEPASAGATPAPSRGPRQRWSTSCTPCSAPPRFPAQFAEQARQQFEGLKALIASGSLDPAVLPVPPQLPGAAANTFRALVAASPKHVDTFIAEQEAVEAIHAELAAAQITSLEDLPLVVLSHGQPMAMPGLTVEVNQAYEQLWQDLQGELAGLSSRGRLVMAQDSGHYIQLERPQLVVDAIAEVVAAARTGSGDLAATASADKEGFR
jgi:hypothetical protein